MWSEAPGHDAARRLVRSALASGRLPSALLVTGEQGLGKRAFADWVAAACWCRESGAPCGDCRVCRQVTSGNHPDLIVVARDPEDPDGLGSRHEITVDQIRRRLIPALGLRPVQTDGHVVVIDGAETMNESAQNALLKTLEEPPAGSVVLLLCSHPEALLETVRSRCQELRLPVWEAAAMAAQHPDVDARVLAMAGGRPGRVAELQRLDIEGLTDAMDGVLSGRQSASGFARAVLTAVEAAAGDGAASGDPHRLAVDVLLRRVLEHAAESDGGTGQAARWQRVEAALFEVSADLARHVPPDVAWIAAGQEFAAVATTDLVG